MGTEILTSQFEFGYNEIAQNNLFDQAPFYEFGRSFWTWSPQLQLHSPCTDPIVTGFAVWMRFRSMAAAQVRGAPFNGTPFATFRSQVAGLEGVYDANTSDTFAGTLCADTSPGMYSGTDFWASIMMKLASHYGGQTFVQRFFSHLASLPAASSTPAAVTNWLLDANYASCVDLSRLFYQRWAFPLPNGTVVSPRPTATSVPFPPSGACGAISGTVTDRTTGTGIGGADAFAYDAPTGVYIEGVYVGSGGQYALGGLPPGTYKVLFQDPSGAHVQQYFNNEASLASADPVTVTGGTTTPNINAALAP
jgi:hypothetical protein